MSLRQLAEMDLAVTMEDPAGFGWDVTLTNPAGASSTGLRAVTGDIGQLIDPDTGTAVSGRLGYVVFRIATLGNQGFGIPRAIDDATAPQWLVQFNDIGGQPWTFRVAETMPDRAIGLVTCMLELYEP